MIFTSILHSEDIGSLKVFNLYDLSDKEFKYELTMVKMDGNDDSDLNRKEKISQLKKEIFIYDKQVELIP